MQLIINIIRKSGLGIVNTGPMFVSSRVTLTVKLPKRKKRAMLTSDGAIFNEGEVWK